nr:hypothetical protein BaRGS_012442 [Batillaria attramentaria]
MPRHYVAYRKSGDINVDGQLNDAGWDDVPWTEDFVDIRGTDFPAPTKETRVKVVWDDTHVYVGAKLIEDQVWATYTQKDTRIYQENAFEIFFDVDNSMTWYKEIEINALGTTWDLQLSRAYIDGGDWMDWEGIAEKGVYADGGVNDISNPSTFWSNEMSFPIANLVENTTRDNVPPMDGEAWFTIFARPQYETRPNQTSGQYEKVPGTDASWWSWNPTGAVALHLPNKWGLLFFSNETASSANFGNRQMNYPAWPTYKGLFDIFEIMQAFKTLNSMFVSDKRQLRLPPFLTDCFSDMQITLTDDGFEATLVSKSYPSMKGHIDQNRHVWFTDA